MCFKNGKLGGGNVENLQVYLNKEQVIKLFKKYAFKVFGYSNENTAIWVSDILKQKGIKLWIFENEKSRTKNKRFWCHKHNYKIIKTLI